MSIATKPPPIIKPPAPKQAFWIGTGLLGIILLVFFQFPNPVTTYNYTPTQLSAIRTDALTPEGFYKPQVDNTGTTYVWTKPRAIFNFNFQTEKPVTLNIEARSAAIAGGVDAPLRLLVNGKEITQFRPEPTNPQFQNFTFRLQPEGGNNLKIEVHAEYFQPPGDGRVLGTMFRNVNVDKTEAWNSFKKRFLLGWVLPLLLIVSFAARVYAVRTSSKILTFLAVGSSVTGLADGLVISYLLLKVGLVEADLSLYCVLTISYFCLVFLLWAINLPLRTAYPPTMLDMGLSRLPHRVRHLLTFRNLGKLLGLSWVLVVAIFTLVLLGGSILSLWSNLTGPETLRYAELSPEEKQISLEGNLGRGLQYVSKNLPVDTEVTVLITPKLVNIGVGFFVNYWLLPRKVYYEVLTDKDIQHKSPYIIYTCSFKIAEIFCPNPIPDLLVKLPDYEVVTTFMGKNEFFGLYHRKPLALNKLEVLS